MIWTPWNFITSSVTGIDPTAYAQLTRSLETIDTERPLHLLVAVSGWLWAKRPAVHPLNSPRDTIYAGDSPLTCHKPACGKPTYLGQLTMNTPSADSQ
jgi:hypothetical protein